MQQRFLLQILLLAQHVSGITMPIIRSSRVFIFRLSRFSVYRGPVLGRFYCINIVTMSSLNPSKVYLSPLEKFQSKYFRTIVTNIIETIMENSDL